MIVRTKYSDKFSSNFSAIKWFNSLKDKHLIKFDLFDIKGFCPSITQDLLNKALTFACEKLDIGVINHARKSLVFDRSHNWIKKQGLFDM